MINIAICDDCEQDSLTLRSIIQEVMDKYSICYHIQEYKSGEKLLESIYTFHLVFLDIILGGKDGIEAGECISGRGTDKRIC